MHDLAGITPINQVVTKSTAAMRPDVIAASKRGAGLIKEGDPGYDIQALFDALAAVNGDREKHGDRPVATGALPSIPDARFPFNGDSLAGALRKHGLSQQTVDGAASRLRGFTSIIPDMRRELQHASSSTRTEVHAACVALLKEALAEVDSWADAVADSCFSDDVLLSWDTTNTRLVGEQARIQDRLKALSHDRIESYLVAVDAAETKARIAHIERLAMAAAEKGKGKSPSI